MASDDGKPEHGGGGAVALETHTQVGSSVVPLLEADLRRAAQVKRQRFAAFSQLVDHFQTRSAARRRRRGP